MNQYQLSVFEVCLLYDDVGSKCDMYKGEYYLSLYDMPPVKSRVIYGIIFMIVAYMVFTFLDCLVLGY